MARYLHIHRRTYGNNYSFLHKLHTPTRDSHFATCNFFQEKFFFSTIFPHFASWFRHWTQAQRWVEDLMYQLIISDALITINVLWFNSSLSLIFRSHDLSCRHLARTTKRFEPHSSNIQLCSLTSLPHKRNTTREKTPTVVDQIITTKTFRLITTAPCLSTLFEKLNVYRKNLNWKKIIWIFSPNFILTFSESFNKCRLNQKTFNFWLMTFLKII